MRLHLETRGHEPVHHVDVVGLARVQDTHAGTDHRVDHERDLVDPDVAGRRNMFAQIGHPTTPSISRCVISRRA
jgi:hypothetical protein